MSITNIEKDEYNYNQIAMPVISLGIHMVSGYTIYNNLNFQYPVLKILIAHLGAMPVTITSYPVIENFVIPECYMATKFDSYTNIGKTISKFASFYFIAKKIYDIDHISENKVITSASNLLKAVGGVMIASRVSDMIELVGDKISSLVDKKDSEDLPELHYSKVGLIIGATVGYCCSKKMMWEDGFLKNVVLGVLGISYGSASGSHIINSIYEYFQNDNKEVELVGEVE